MIPSKDAKFLRSLLQSLEGNALTYYRPGRRRSAHALILRFEDSTAKHVARLFASHRRLSVPAIVASLGRFEDTQATQSSLRILLVRRSSFASDRWSGQVALPGGRRDFEHDRDDTATVNREAYTSLGIPLDGRDFVLLGRLDDVALASKDPMSSLDGDAVQSRFVYLHVGEMTPSVQLATHDVESVRWCPLEAFSYEFVEHGRVVHHLMHFVPFLSSDIAVMVRDVFPMTHLAFPSINVACEGSPPWRVWGVALRNVSDLIQLRGVEERRLDWPVFSTNNFLLQHAVVNPWHGFLLLRDESLRRRWKEYPQFVLSFAALCVVVAAILLSVSRGVFDWIHAFAFVATPTGRQRAAAGDHAANGEIETDPVLRVNTSALYGHVNPKRVVVLSDAPGDDAGVN